MPCTWTNVTRGSTTNSSIAKLASSVPSSLEFCAMVEAHRTVSPSYIEDGIKLLELAHRAHALFETQRQSCCDKSDCGTAQGPPVVFART
jgi:hypothetical protein